MAAIADTALSFFEHIAKPLIEAAARQLSKKSYCQQQLIVNVDTLLKIVKDELEIELKRGNKTKLRQLHDLDMLLGNLKEMESTNIGAGTHAFDIITKQGFTVELIEQTVEKSFCERPSDDAEKCSVATNCCSLIIWCAFSLKTTEHNGKDLVKAFTRIFRSLFSLEDTKDSATDDERNSSTRLGRSSLEADCAEVGREVKDAELESWKEEEDGDFDDDEMFVVDQLRKLPRHQLAEQLAQICKSAESGEFAE